MHRKKGLSFKQSESERKESILTLLLTVYGHQNSSASSALVLDHGFVDFRCDLQAVPPHPLPVPNQDYIGGCLKQACKQQQEGIKASETQLYSNCNRAVGMHFQTYFAAVGP